MTSNMSTVDVIISSMVFNYLKKIDTKLAQEFKKKTNALTLSKGSPEIHVIFNHFIKTNTLSKKIKLDAVDDDNIENNEQKKQKKASTNSNKTEAEVEDIHQLNISAASVPIENTAVGVDLDYESEEDDSSEDLQLPTEPKNDITGAEMEALEDEDDDSEKESDNEGIDDESEDNEDDGLDNGQPDYISFKGKPKVQEQSEDREDQADWPSRGRGGFRNRGGFHRGRGQGWGEGRGRGDGGGNRGNFRGGFRGGFRGRFNDNRGGRGRGRGRGRFGGHEGSRGRGNFNNRHSNDFHGSPPQAKKLKFDN